MLWSVPARKSSVASAVLLPEFLYKALVSGGIVRTRRKGQGDGFVCRVACAAILRFLGSHRLLDGILCTFPHGPGHGGLWGFSPYRQTGVRTVYGALSDGPETVICDHMCVRVLHQAHITTL